MTEERGLGAGFVLALMALAVLQPARASALEPRFDHRELQGPTAELLVIHDVVWRGSADAASSSRGAARIAWSFDPTGDGDELFFGATIAAVDLFSTGRDPIKLTFDARYRACLGTDEFKTLLEIGLWGSALDRVAVGPLVGFGFMYDFSRNFGVLASGFLAAGIGDGRVISYGGGIGAQYRFE
jgi:hypothetical protein